MVSRYNLIDQREIEEKSAIFYGEDPQNRRDPSRELGDCVQNARVSAWDPRKIDGKRRRKVSLSAPPSLSLLHLPLGNGPANLFSLSPPLLSLARENP